MIIFFNSILHRIHELLEHDYLRAGTYTCYLHLFFILQSTLINILLNFYLAIAKHFVIKHK